MGATRRPCAGWRNRTMIGSWSRAQRRRRRADERGSGEGEGGWMRDVCACGGGGPWPHGDILMVERPFTHKMPFMCGRWKRGGRGSHSELKFPGTN
eukprot:scaffold4755_cov123-Isochrysis_galbana.AAC.9